MMAGAESACPVIFRLVWAWRTYLSTEDRARLILPLEPRLVGTRSTKEVEKRRSLMAADWLVRVNAPALLRLTKLSTQAEALEALPEITSLGQATSIREPIETARELSKDTRAAEGRSYTAVIYPVFKHIPRATGMAAVTDAAMFAAKDTVWEVARETARDAVWVAAKYAAKAAAIAHPDRDAARDAQKEHARERDRFLAMVAAGDAKREDEWDALAATRSAEQAALVPIIAAAKTGINDTFQPTVERLQLSMLDLVDRMIDLRDTRSLLRQRTESIMDLLWPRWLDRRHARCSD